MPLSLRLRACGALAFAFFLARAEAADLTAYTEEWPPYNFSEGSEITGIATDILRAACRDARLDCAIQIAPWARGYATVSRKPGTLLYTTARKPSRENEFLWVGPLFPRTTWVYGRAGTAAKIQSLAQLAGHRVGIVRGEAAAQDLEAAGVPKAALRPEASNAAVLKLLLGGWVDAIVDTEIGMAWNLRNAGVAASEVERLVKLSDEGGYYFALNKDTDPALRDRLQKAVDGLRRTGALASLTARYAARPR